MIHGKKLTNPIPVDIATTQPVTPSKTVDGCDSFVPDRSMVTGTSDELVAGGGFEILIHHLGDQVLKRHRRGPSQLFARF